MPAEFLYCGEHRNSAGVEESCKMSVRTNLRLYGAAGILGLCAVYTGAVSTRVFTIVNRDAEYNLFAFGVARGRQEVVSYHRMVLYIRILFLRNVHSTRAKHDSFDVTYSNEQYSTYKYN